MTKAHRLLQIFLWSYVVVYCVFNILLITQVDLWWQLAEGRHILHTGTLPTGPVAAFGLPAHPYFDEYAGYEVVLAMLYKFGGFLGIWLVFSAIYVLILFLPFKTPDGDYPRIDFLAGAAMLFAGLVMRERLEQRPEFVATLFLVLLMMWLRASRLETFSARATAGLFVLFVAWSNTHSTFLIGYVVLGLWTACEIAARHRQIAPGLLAQRALALAGVVLLAAMINPYGPRRLLFPFLQAFDPGATALSPEMWPITDFTSSVAVLFEIALVLLVWGIVRTRPAAWLILFSLLSVGLAWKSSRFMGLVALSLLFVYAERREPEVETASGPLVLGLRIIGIGAAGIFVALGAAFNLVWAYAELRSEPRLATHTVGFAPALCALPLDGGSARIPLLCGHGVESYISFRPNSRFRPLLDSGLSHFSDESKRYYFLVWSDPEAFRLALQQLHVDYVLVNKDTYQWLPTLSTLPDWQFVTCDDAGVLFHRCAAGRRPLTDAQRGLITECIDVLMERRQQTAAFAYSTLLDDPVASLDLLEKGESPDWNSPVFASICDWVLSIPTATVQAYLAGQHPHSRLLVDAILAARLGPTSFDAWLATAPPGPRGWCWRALEVQNSLRKNDPAQARQIFDSISPVPVSSAAYYRLRQEVVAAAGDHSPLTPYAEWQTWDASGPAFITRVSASLNDRLAELAQKQNR